jgi:hypothetical protein
MGPHDRCAYAVCSIYTAPRPHGTCTHDAKQHAEHESQTTQFSPARPLLQKTLQISCDVHENDLAISSRRHPARHLPLRARIDVPSALMEPLAALIDATSERIGVISRWHSLAAVCLCSTCGRYNTNTNTITNVYILVTHRGLSCSRVGWWISHEKVAHRIGFVITHRQARSHPSAQY